LDTQPQENKGSNVRASTLPPSTGLDMPASGRPTLPDHPAQIAPVGQSSGASSAGCPRRGLVEAGTPAEEASPRKKLRTAGTPPSGNNSRPKHRPLRRSKRSCVLRKAEDCASQESTCTDLEGCPNNPNKPVVRGALTLDQIIASSRQPSLARGQSGKRQDDGMHDEEMRDLASMEQHAKDERDGKASQKDSRGNDAEIGPSTSSLVPRTTAQRPTIASQTRSRSPTRMLEALSQVLRHAPQGVPQTDNNPFSSGRFFEAFHASSQPPPLPHGYPSGLSFSMSALQGNAAQVQLTTSLIPQSSMPSANPPPATGPRDASGSAEAAAHSAGGLPPSGRERSHSPMPFWHHLLRDARYGNASSYRAAARTRGNTGRPDSFMHPWSGASPASGTSSSLLPDARASMPNASSSDEPSQVPSNAAAHMAYRRRRDERASSIETRAERVQLESLDHPLQSALEGHRSMHRQLNSTLRSRRDAPETLMGARETLMDSSKPTSLQLFGSEATPRGISSTPLIGGMLGTPSHQYVVAPPGGLSLDAAMQCAEHPCCNGDKVIKILELPLCLCGHRPDLIAQVNAQASPQFEKLGAYLVRIGCCKVCEAQVCLPVPS
jgi:hypothetical protein